MTHEFTADQSVAADDGHIIHCRISEPEGVPHGVIQILHGLAEHCARYGRFAAVARAHGYVVVTHDHRGHGPNAEVLGHFADENGFDKVLADVGTVNSWLHKRWQQVPVVLLGHSMGSFIAQAYATQRPGSFSLLILSGSALPGRFQTWLGRLVARIERWRRGGGRAKSPVLDKLGFGRFNEAFQPARTEFDWLSRDHEEVNKYVSDPLCGKPSSCQLWIDLMGGLLRISRPAALREIPVGMPMLIFGGSDDPVGGERGLTALAETYRATGHRNVTLSIYPQGRHEMFNEINRDEVTGDVLAWIDGNIVGNDSQSTNRSER